MSFYRKSKETKSSGIFPANFPSRTFFSLERLERASDTEDYTRQVSTLLKETVEPPNFRLNPFPSENSIPNGSRGISDYPLWYKEPHEIPLMFSNPITQPDA